MDAAPVLAALYLAAGLLGTRALSAGEFGLALASMAGAAAVVLGRRIGHRS